MCLINIAHLMSSKRFLRSSSCAAVCSDNNILSRTIIKRNSPLRDITPLSAKRMKKIDDSCVLPLMYDSNPSIIAVGTMSETLSPIKTERKKRSSRKSILKNSISKEKEKINEDVFDSSVYKWSETYDEEVFLDILNRSQSLVTRGGWRVSDGIQHLVNIDNRFKDLVFRYGIPSIFEIDHDENIDPFHALLKTIVYQQLATKAADTVFQRFSHALSPDVKLDSICPKHVLNSSFDVTMIDGKKKVLVNGVTSGLSESKSKYIVSLAEHFNDDSKLMNVDFNSLSDDELFKRLVDVKGLGPWSVHMFMIFTLHRPNVLPVGDLGLRRGLCSFHNLSRKRIEGSDSSIELKELCASWSPYCSLGSLYMWKVSDDAKK